MTVKESLIMSTKVRSLDKKWKEIVFAMSGLGPNLMMILMGAYFTDAIDPTMLMASTNPDKYLMMHSGFLSNSLGGLCYILPLIFPVLWAISKAFDGIIDIPFAKITDSLNTKWGRRRPPILICFIPMVLSFIMCWLPIGGYIFPAEALNEITEAAQTFNTIWITVFALIFFSTYTMCLIAFYGSLSQVCEDESQRIRVSSYKAVVDTIVYALVYALVPVILGATQQNIDKVAIFGSVLMCTMLIPLFIIKEGEKYGYPEKDGLKEEHVSILQSLKVTFGNRVFMSWLVVNCTAFFGLQMFLVSMNAIITGGMNFGALDMAIIETCAFGPVPMMLYLFNKVKRKKGLRFTYQTCLIAFAIAILSFDLASVFVTGGNKPVQFVIAIVGALIGSWGIGAFFMMPLLIPAQVSSIEEKLTKTNHSAMYFAAQAVTTSVIGALASALYEVIKHLYFNKETGAADYIDGYLDGTEAWIGIEQDAMMVLGGSLKDGTLFSLGALLVPIVVSIMCIVGFLFAFKMPKDFSPKIVARELKKHNPELDISSVENEVDEVVAKEKEVTLMNVIYWVLSGGIFGFIWSAFQYNNIKSIDKKALIGGSAILTWILSAFVPFVSIYTTYRIYKNVIVPKASEQGIKTTGMVAHIICGILLPIYPVNVVSLALLQKDLNKVDA